MEIIPIDLKERLNNFEELVMSNKQDKDTEYGKYYSAMYTGTNSRTARIERGELFKKHVINSVG